MTTFKKRESIKSKLLLASVGNDETRVSLTHICHVSELQALIALDGYRLTLLKSRYSPSLADILICPKTFATCTLEYPQVAKVLPDVNKGQRYELKIEKHHYSKDKSIYIYERDEGIAFLSYEENLKDVKYLTGIQARYLKHLNTDLWINIKYYGKKKPILFDLTSIDHLESMQFEDIYLTMSYVKAGK